MKILFYPLSWTVARSIRISYSRLYRHLLMVVWMSPISSQAVNSGAEKRYCPCAISTFAIILADDPLRHLSQDVLSL